MCSGKTIFFKMMTKSIANDWVGGLRERHCRAALASLDFFGSVFYQEKIERIAGEANVELKNIVYYNKDNIGKCTFSIIKLLIKSYQNNRITAFKVNRKQ